MYYHALLFIWVLGMELSKYSQKDLGGYLLLAQIPSCHS